MSEARDWRTVAHIWRDRVRRSPSALAFRFRRDGSWTTLTWKQADERVRRVAAGLIAAGVAPSDRVAILCGTRIEWILVDFGVLCAGAATTTIYPSSTPEECAWILRDSGARVCVVEDREQLEKIEAVRAELPALERVVVVEDEAELPEGHCTLHALEERGERWLDAHPDGIDARIEALAPSDLATLIYTSGTTGPPKGVMLTHDNWVFQAEALSADVGRFLQPGDLQYLFLPLAHAFGKVCELIAVAVGAPTAVEGDVEHLLEGVQRTRPTLMAAVPRVFEKVYNRVVSRAREAGPRRYAIFRWAVAVADEAARLELEGRRVPLALRVRRRLAQRLVHRKLEEALGGRMRAFVSGGAPLSEEIARFFYGAGILILEGYGMTETSAGACANQLDDFRFGTVGRPLQGCEVRIADDGEILLRGRNIMTAYWNRPEATAEALDDDGWMHTGDLGRLDDEGRLHVTGRKKDLIITAGGKNIAPQNVESRIKTRSPFVQEVVMHGDRRPYCVALVSVDGETVAKWAAEQGLSGSYAELSAHPAVHDLVWSVVDEVNRELPSYETIKRIALLDHELSQETGELTPSLKVKRRVVEERYRDLLDRCYGQTVERL